jgi:hypothetical protein
LNVRKTQRQFLLGSTAILLGALAIAGCKPSHPDEKPVVTSSLSTNNLSAVSVSEDRETGRHGPFRNGRHPGSEEPG